MLLRAAVYIKKTICVCTHIIITRLVSIATFDGSTFMMLFLAIL